MALTMPNPTPILTGKYHTFWRIAALALYFVFTSAVTAAVFLLIPSVNENVKMALDLGGVTFILVVIVPSGIFSLVMLAVCLWMLWRATSGLPDEE